MTQISKPMRTRVKFKNNFLLLFKTHFSTDTGLFCAITFLHSPQSHLQNIPPPPYKKKKNLYSIANLLCVHQAFINIFFFLFLDERNTRLFLSSKNKKKKTLYTHFFGFGEPRSVKVCQSPIPFPPKKTAAVNLHTFYCKLTVFAFKIPTFLCLTCR